MKKIIKKTFTLVELIIVIAIIAILAVTAFLLLTQRLSKARDSRRIADIGTISKSLNIYYAENTKYPKPSDNVVSITTSGSTTIIGYQGNFGERNKSDLGINGEIKDPNTNELYTYKVNDTLTNYAILGYTENEMSYANNQTNATDFTALFPRIDGEAGIIMDSTQTPVQNVTSVVASGYIDIFNTTNTYRVYLNNKEYLEGTGIALQGIQQFGENGYGAPLSCPTGFIPVPGNKDFKQAGFCVAKYEMKQINGSAGYFRYTGVLYSGYVNSSTEICSQAYPCPTTAIANASTGLDNNIISKAEGNPIVYINQATAIQACKSMGNGYHLITNNEWMTIARNIEMQAENWSSGILGSGGIYRGNSNRGTYTTINTDKNSIDCYDATDNNGQFIQGGMQADANSKLCQLPDGRNKRALKLSNNQWVWDFAGNLWEHVNGANTIDGTGYGSMQSNACNGTDLGNDGYTTNNGDRYAMTDNDVTASFSKCNLTNGYSWDNIGPKLTGLTINNGMGRIYSSISTINNFDRVFLRGGQNYRVASIYAIYLGYGKINKGYNVSFRCAK